MLPAILPNAGGLTEGFSYYCILVPADVLRDAVFHLAGIGINGLGFESGGACDRLTTLRGAKRWVLAFLNCCLF
jgi:hypothetical protein